MLVSKISQVERMQNAQTKVLRGATKNQVSLSNLKFNEVKNEFSPAKLVSADKKNQRSLSSHASPEWCW